MKIAITGSREIKNADIIYDVMCEVLTSTDIDEIFFGGAVGVDSIALQYIYDILESINKFCRLTVIVPFTVSKQPKSVIPIIYKYSNKIIEMKQSFSKYAYLKRNDELVRHACLVIAFWDGRDGGTKYTINKAIELNKPVEIIRLDEALGAANKFTTKDNVSYYYFPSEDVYVMEPFSRHTTLGGKIMALKQYKKTDVSQIASNIISILQDIGISKGVLLAVPRRTVGKLSGVVPILDRIEKMSGGKFVNMADGLIRVKELKKGVVIKGREQFDPEEHAESMKISGLLKEYKHLPAIIIDDVITQGGSMKGARKVARTIFSEVIAIALTGGGKFGEGMM